MSDKKKNLNVKFPESDYVELKKISEKIGVGGLSNLIRILVNTQLAKVRESGNSFDFLKITYTSNIHDKLKREDKGEEKKNLNVKFPVNDYNKIKEISETMGVGSLSNLIRPLVNTQLARVRESGSAWDFLQLTIVNKAE